MTTIQEEDRTMNTSDLNYDRAMEYAKGMAGYSNLARCYIAMARRLAAIDKKSVQQYVQPEPEGESNAQESIEPVRQEQMQEPVKRKPGRPRKEDSNEIDL